MSADQREADALKPCPCRWCGSEYTSVGENKSGVFWGQCDNPECLAEGPARKTSADAIATWNARAPLAPPTEAEVEAAAAAIGDMMKAGRFRTYPDMARAALSAFIAMRNK